MRRVIPAVVTGLLALGAAPVAQAAKAPDAYTTYADLAAHESEGKDYRRVQRLPRKAKVAHIAIHGGAIEAPTSQLADHAAGSRHAFYSFEGLKPSGNRVLHITSTRFDEPRGRKVAAAVDYTVSWHATGDTKATTYVGGRDRKLAKKVATALRAAGFTVAASTPKELDGDSPANIANRNRRGMGVQLEVSRGQRERFFANGDLSRAWVEDPAHRTRAFYRYVAAVNSALP
ncbi:poly-gamma-glutamate hydrolase family protein [Nonomuraea sp. NPDC059194]|uniref:poly-gamma-glutamate hydrolase family protein n=1 Tax=Nonomuraea sp. NPDC059194 TaxID=3346764 RepID=UPI0036BA6D42